MELNEVEEPHPGPGEVVVEVKASGVCHSDVTTLDDPGWMELFQHGLPRTMGRVRGCGQRGRRGHGPLATDAGLTAYHAMMAVGGAQEGMKVGVIGLGGLGYIGARCAALVGAEVYGGEDDIDVGAAVEHPRSTPRRRSWPMRSV